MKKSSILSRGAPSVALCSIKHITLSILVPSLIFASIVATQAAKASTNNCPSSSSSSCNEDLTQMSVQVHDWNSALGIAHCGASVIPVCATKSKVHYVNQYGMSMTGYKCTSQTEFGKGLEAGSWELGNWGKTLVCDGSTAWPDNISSSKN